MSIEHGTYQVLGMEEIIASAKMQLKIETTDQDLWFTKLVDQAVRRLDCLSIFNKKVTSLTVTNGMAKLPKGFVALIGLRIGEPGNCAPAIYVSLPFIKACGCSTGVTNVQSQVGVFEIQGGYIIFHPNSTVDDEGVVTTQEITACTIAYFGYNIDDSGLMAVYEHYELALTAYLCWQYCLQNFAEYPRDVRYDYKAEWINQKKFVKSKDFNDNFKNEKRQVMEVVNAVISSKFWTND